MSAKKVGTLIKTGRTNAGLTQQAVADKVPGLSASDIGKAERGEKELTTDQLKAVAKAIGVTQKSLLEAAGTAKKTTTSTKPSSSTTSSSAKTTDLKLTATEKKLVELYRSADSDTKKKVMSILKGEKSETDEMISSLLENAVGAFLKK